MSDFVVHATVPASYGLENREIESLIRSKLDLTPSIAFSMLSNEDELKEITIVFELKEDNQLEHLLADLLRLEQMEEIDTPSILSTPNIVETLRQQVQGENLGDNNTYVLGRSYSETQRSLKMEQAVGRGVIHRSDSSIQIFDFE